MFVDGTGSYQTFCIQMVPGVLTTNTVNPFFRDIEAKKGVPSFSDGGSARNPIDILDIGWAEITAVSTERDRLVTHHPTDIFVSSF